MGKEELREQLNGKTLDLASMFGLALQNDVEQKALLHILLDNQIKILAKLSERDEAEVEKEVNDAYTAKYDELDLSNLETLVNIGQDKK